MYSQYTTEHETELGLIKIERTYKDNELDSVLVITPEKIIELPKHVAKQTSQTIIRKVCAWSKLK